MPPEAGLFSTKTRWPSASLSLSAMNLAGISVGPPTPKPTTSLIGRSGQLPPRLLLGDSATNRHKISRPKRRMLALTSPSQSPLASPSSALMANFKSGATMVSLMTARWEPETEGYSLRVLRMAMTVTAVSLGAVIAHVGLTSPAASQALALTTTDAMNSYNEAVSRFKSVLRQRRTQIDSQQKLPDLPGQALYLARNDMLSTYKDLTDVLPSKIGRPNKFKIPPAYFDADNEPLLDEYGALFKVVQAPPANAQNSATPFKDVVDLGTAIARAKGLDQANAQIAGRISLGLFFAETNGNQNIGNARSNTYKGSLQTGISESQLGQRKWAAIKNSIAAFDPALIARDSEEEKRTTNLDHRFNHWTAVRDGLMNAHAELFLRIPALVKALPDPIDQMKVFEL